MEPAGSTVQVTFPGRKLEWNEQEEIRKALQSVGATVFRFWNNKAWGYGEKINEKAVWSVERYLTAIRRSCNVVILPGPAWKLAS